MVDGTDFCCGTECGVGPVPKNVWRSEPTVRTGQTSLRWDVYCRVCRKPVAGVLLVMATSEAVHFMTLPTMPDAVHGHCLRREQE